MVSQVANEKLNELTQRIHSLAKSGANSFSATLEHYRQIGNLLLEAKATKIIPHGEFSNWCEQTFGFKKTQRADYMRLADGWASIPVAREWAQSACARFDDQSLSGVTRMLRDWKRRDIEKRSRPRKNTSNVEAEISRLKTEISTLEVQNDALTAENTVLRAKLKSARQKAASGTTIPDSEAAKAIKVFELWSHVTTAEGIVENAEIKLLKLAARRAVSVQSYLALLGLEVPAHRNFGKDTHQGSLRRAA